MRICFIALICILPFNTLHARYFIVGAKAGTGFLYNPNGGYLPNIESTGTVGIELGVMPGKHLGVMTGICKSWYKFNISDAHYPVGSQSLSYINIPISCRLILGRSLKARVYIQAGLDFCFPAAAHYQPTGNGKYNNIITYESDNKNDFRPISFRPVVEVGLVRKVANCVYLMLGAGLSVAGQDIIVNESPRESGRKNIQGADANMGLSYLDLMLGLQFHFAYSNARN